MSVTFVSLMTGWVLGVYGGCQSCQAVLLETRDGGATWRGVSAPPTTIAATVAGPGAVRFANLADGWIAHGDLWVTHDGGAHWRQIMQLPDADTTVQVRAMGTDGSRVYVAYDRTDGLVGLASSPVATDKWTSSTITLSCCAGPIPRTILVLQGGSGWVAEWDRVFVDGARLINGSWTPWAGPCPGLAGWGVFAASTASDLVSVCDDIWGANPDPYTAVDHVFTSRDGGRSMTATATTTWTTFDQIASPTPGVIVADRDGLQRSTDNGRTWATVAKMSDPLDQAFFTGLTNDLGFTDPNHGVVITADGNLLLSHDAGQTWNPADLTKPTS